MMLQVIRFMALFLACQGCPAYDCWHPERLTPGRGIDLHRPVHVATVGLSTLKVSRAWHLAVGVKIDGRIQPHEINGRKHSTLPPMAGGVYTCPFPDSSWLLSLCLALRCCSVPFLFCMSCSSEIYAELLHNINAACPLWPDLAPWFSPLNQPGIVLSIF